MAKASLGVVGVYIHVHPAIGVLGSFEASQVAG